MTPRKRRKKRGRERGVALILVLGALTILTVMLTDFQDETSAELGSALSARDGLRAEYAARSAIALSRLLIAAEPTIRKSVSIFFIASGGAPQIPVWQFADQILGAFNDSSGQAKFSSLASVNMEKSKKLGLEGAGFDIQIIDEDAKINLNSGARDPLSQGRLAAQIMALIGPLQYEPMFTSRDGDGQYSDRLQTCSAIIDWTDPDVSQATCDLTRAAQGPSLTPEDSFYQMLDPPYFRKNAAYDSLEELHNVRGVSDDFWSTFIDPDPNDPTRRNVTVWGTGKVNVNTANPQTLYAVICQPGNGASTTAKMCTDPLEGAKFLAALNMVRMFTQGAPIFTSANGFILTLKQQTPIGNMLKQFLNMDPIVFGSEAEVKKMLSAESKVFTIIATGRVKSGQRDTRVRVQAVVDFRNAPTPQQLLVNSLPPGAAQALGIGGAAGIGGSPGLGAAGLPGMGLGTGLGSDVTNAMPYPGFVQGQLPANAPPGATLDSVMSYLMASPGGRIVYFRID